MLQHLLLQQISAKVAFFNRLIAPVPNWLALQPLMKRHLEKQMDHVEAAAWAVVAPTLKAALTRAQAALAILTVVRQAQVPR